jgi:hypothetical protein
MTLRRMGRSFRRVGASGVADTMQILRYCVRPRDGGAGAAKEGFWSLVNTPVQGPDGRPDHKQGHRLGRVVKMTFCTNGLF